MNTKKTATAGSTILATMSSRYDEQMSIKTTEDVTFNDFHEVYYVTGFKIMKSSGRVSKTERIWCFVDFEVVGV